MPLKDFDMETINGSHETREINKRIERRVEER